MIKNQLTIQKTNRKFFFTFKISCFSFSNLKNVVFACGKKFFSYFRKDKSKEFSSEVLHVSIESFQVPKIDYCEISGIFPNKKFSQKFFPVWRNSLSYDPFFLKILLGLMIFRLFEFCWKNFKIDVKILKKRNWRLVIKNFFLSLKERFLKKVNEFWKQMNEFGKKMNEFWKQMNEFGKKGNEFWENMNEFWKQMNEFWEKLMAEILLTTKNTEEINYLIVLSRNTSPKILWKIYKKFFYHLSFEEFLNMVDFLLTFCLSLLSLILFYSLTDFIDFKYLKIFLKSIDFTELKLFLKSGNIKYLKNFFVNLFFLSEILANEETLKNCLATSLLSTQEREFLVRVQKVFGKIYAAQLEVLFKILPQIEGKPFVEIVYSELAKKKAISFGKKFNHLKIKTFIKNLNKNHITKVLKHEKKHIKTLKTFNKILRYYFSLALKKRVWNLKK